MLFQVLAIVGQPGQFVAFDVMQCIGERHVTVFVVMAIRFAISGDVDKLWPGTALAGKSRQQSRSELFSASKQILKSDRLRHTRVIKENGNCLSGWKPHFIRRRWVDGASVDVFPRPAFQSACTPCLVWRKDGIANAETTEHI